MSQEAEAKCEHRFVVVAYGPRYDERCKVCGYSLRFGRPEAES